MIPSLPEIQSVFRALPTEYENSDSSDGHGIVALVKAKNGYFIAEYLLTGERQGTREVRGFAYDPTLIANLWFALTGAEPPDMAAEIAAYRGES